MEQNKTISRIFKVKKMLEMFKDQAMDHLLKNRMCKKTNFKKSKENFTYMFSWKSIKEFEQVDF
jgi:hypothetical protein